jgi:hypothetical protein
VKNQRLVHVLKKRAGLFYEANGEIEQSKRAPTFPAQVQG